MERERIKEAVKNENAMIQLGAVVCICRLPGGGAGWHGKASCSDAQVEQRTLIAWRICYPRISELGCIPTATDLEDATDGSSCSGGLCHYFLWHLSGNNVSRHTLTPAADILIVGVSRCLP